MKRLGLLWLSVSIAGFSCSKTTQKLTVENVWSMPAQVSGKMDHQMSGHAGHGMGNMHNGVVYMTIKNPTETVDRLLDVRTDVCKVAELHETTTNDDRMVMQKLDGGVEIAAGEQVVFEPRGKHIMLLDLKQALEVGNSFKLTLSFEKAGDIEVSSVVRTP